MIRPADNNPTLLLLLSEVRKNGEAINAVNGRLTSVEDCTRQNVSRLNKVEELIMMTVGPIRELLVPNVEVTEMQLMSKAHSHHTAELPRCLLKFHKGIHAVTFHPISYEAVHSKVDYDKYPNKNVKTLVALEDLGRGST
eukprot:scaffold4144_cov261-Ochromonas_danica.AAC.1